jgi:hypothetical protein
MNASFIINKILEQNKLNINHKVEENVYNNVISRYFDLKIVIDYFELCDEYPESINQVVKLKSFSKSIEEEIHLYIEACISKLDYENANIINKSNLYEIIFVHLIPIVLFTEDICMVYDVVRSRTIPVYDIKTTTKKSKPKKKSNEIQKRVCRVYNFLVLRGTSYKFKEKLTLRSSFFVCENELCKDKNYLLKLKSVNYLIKDSKKSFIHLVDTNHKNCLNCKSDLIELIKFRVYTKEFEYIISDGIYSIYGQSNHVLESTGYFEGILERRNSGKLYLKVERSYNHDIDYYKYKVSKEINITLRRHDFTRYLLSVTNFVFSPIKKNCDLYDCLLLIILNILSNNESRMLIFTTDTCYIRKCALNLFQIKNMKTNLYYDLKSLNKSKGLCIRDYEEVKINNIDYVFHIPIKHLLDYSYQASKDDIEISKINKELNENDHKNIQELFIEFRREYKRVLEPERLLNTLTSLYISVYEYTNDTEYINEFILNNFLDKLL